MTEIGIFQIDHQIFNRGRHFLRLLCKPRGHGARHIEINVIAIGRITLPRHLMRNITFALIEISWFFNGEISPAQSGENPPHQKNQYTPRHRLQEYARRDWKTNGVSGTMQGRDTWLERPACDVPFVVASLAPHLPEKWQRGLFPIRQLRSCLKGHALNLISSHKEGPSIGKLRAYNSKIKLMWFGRRQTRESRLLPNRSTQKGFSYQVMNLSYPPNLKSVRPSISAWAKAIGRKPLCSADGSFISTSILFKFPLIQKMRWLTIWGVFLALLKNAMQKKKLHCWN